MKVFLTGANGAIGSAIRDKFLSLNHEVVGPSSSELDLSDVASVARYFETHAADFDVIVHCAGYNKPLEMTEFSLTEYEKTQTVNVTAFLEIVRRNIPYFKEKGCGYVLGIASLYGTITREGRMAYTVSKHGIIGAVQTLALELGQYGVLCNTVSPGFVDTPMFRRCNTPEQRDLLCRKIPVGRLSDGKDIANVVSFLCSAENTYVTGQDITVDGGFMCGGFQRG